MAKVRLNRYLAQCGVASRRGADDLILEGRVKVNARVVEELGVTIDPTEDEVRVGRKRVGKKPLGVKLFHKPRHVITSLSDPEKRQCIAHYLGRAEQGYFPVGRLDYDSTGLVILTNDGDLAERLLHPRYGWERTYEVRVSGVVTEKTLRRITRGVKLPDGFIKGSVKVIRTLQDATWMRITLTSGRNKIIRRLMEHLRHPVAKLHRVSHGPFALGKLRRGEIGELTQDRYELLRERVMKGVPTSKRKKPSARTARKPARKPARK